MAFVELLRYGVPIATIFDLLGRKEDDMTYALGFVLSRSPRFAAAVAEEIGGSSDDFADGIVKLQTSDDDGRTDVEADAEGAFVVFEAKRGPNLPSLRQLERYTRRIPAQRALRRLVAVTNAPEEYARATLPDQVGGVTIAHLRWCDVRRLARRARRRESNANKRLLDEFGRYLTELVGMEIGRSNMVLVLAIGSGSAWGLNFRDVATTRRAYFDAVKKHRSKGRPNYIAFRYDGRLQSIHHVDGAELFTNPRHVFGDAQDVEVEPHYLLRLGPPIVPSREVKYGAKISWNMRVYCMIDTLLTSSTITEAYDETRRRIGEDATGV